MRNIETNNSEIGSIEELLEKLDALGDKTSIDDELEAIQSMYREFIKYLETSIPSRITSRGGAKWD